MNKKYKILFSLCAVFVFAFSMLMVNLQPLIAKADSIDTTYNVSFIAPDNSLLTQLNDVPYGVSLQSLQDSNLLLNSEFIDLTADFADNWTISSGLGNKGTVSFSNDSCTCTCDTITPSLTSFLYQRVDVSSYVGNYITGSIFVNNINNDRNYATRLNIVFRNSSLLYISEIVVNITSSGVFSTSGQIPANTVYADFQLGMTGNNLSGDSFTFSRPKLQLGNEYTPYFSSILIDHFLSSYDSEDYIYSYDIDYSQPITSDMYFYPVTNYESGFLDGMNYANNFYEGFGIFKYSTYSFVKRTDYSYIYNDFTGRFTTTYFDYYNGGFIINSTLFHLVDVYCFNNEIDDIVLKIDFDNPVEISKYSFYTFYNFQFGNSVEFILSNGVTLSYDYSDLSSSALSLVEYDSLSINSIIVGFASSFGDYGEIGISCNSNYTYSYNKGFYDGYNSGNTDGYNSGYRIGERSGYDIGYQKGVDDSGNYTFFGLISAVIDAPLKVFYGLFNFDLMGVNLAGFIQALLSLAILIFIIRFALQK